MVKDQAFYNLQAYVETLVGVGPTHALLYYQGPIPGSEFLIYDANKLYIYFELEHNCSVPGVAAAQPGLTLYDEANAVNHYVGDAFGYWDVTAAAPRYAPNSITWINGFFSRLVANGVTHMKFNGIKITWP